MTRAEAEAILTAREGTPPEHLECCATDDLIHAALADAGQPCGDCGALVLWDEESGWQHAEPAVCFLAAQEAPRPATSWYGRRVRSVGTPLREGTVRRRSGDELVVDWDEGPSPTRVGTASVRLVRPFPTLGRRRV